MSDTIAVLVCILIVLYWAAVGAIGIVCVILARRTRDLHERIEALERGEGWDDDPDPLSAPVRTPSVAAYMRKAA